MIFNSYSIGLFDNYYELTDDEGLGLIILLILVVILNLSNIIIKAAKRGSIAYKYPR